MKMPWMSYKKIINFWKSENTGDNGHQNHVFFDNYHFERAYMSRKRVFRKKWKYEITLLSWTEIPKISWKKWIFRFFCTFFVQYFKNTLLCGFLKVGKSVIFGFFSANILKYLKYLKYLVNGNLFEGDRFFSSRFANRKIDPNSGSSELKYT